MSVATATVGPGPGGGAPRDGTYVVSPAVDLAMVGGASILVIAAMRFLHSGARTQGVISTAYLLMWIVNWPHFSATSYRLYGSRENMRQYPVTAFVTPLFALMGVAASLADPDGVAPAFVKLFLIWSPYHFSGQTLGVTLLYARRAGFEIRPWERRILTGCIYGTFLGMTARGELGSQTLTYFGVKYPTFGIPTWMAQGLLYGAYGFAAAFVLVALGWLWRSRGRMPLVLVVVPAAQFVWFMPGVGTASGYEFVPFFHSLQYLFLAWALNLRETLDQGGGKPSSAFVLAETGRWGAVNFLGGMTLFWIFPRLGMWASGLDLHLAEGIVISGVQIHHFFVDGVIWRLRNPRVASPLMMRFEDLASDPQAPEPSPEAREGPTPPATSGPEAPIPGSRPPAGDPA